MCGMWEIIQFSDTELSFSSWNKPHLVLLYYVVNKLMYSVNSLLSAYTSMFISEMSL